MPSSRFAALTAAWMSLLALGCPWPPGGDGGGQGSDSGEPEPAEEAVAQVTVWDDRFEIFLEHRYIVANKKVNFITHVTNRTTDEPRREGPLVFILSDGNGEPIRRVEDRPSRDGIYIPTLTFPRSGDWTVTLAIPSELAETRIELPRFRVHANQSDADDAAADRAEPAEGIDFLKEQQWKIGLATEPARTKNVIERLRLSGIVKASPHLTGDVSPVVAGRLIAPEAGAIPSVGDRVEAGQVIAFVQPPLAGPDLLTFLGNKTQIATFEVELTVKRAEAEAARATAVVALEHAEKVYARTKELHGKGAKSDREFEEADRDLDRARAEIDAARALRDAYEKASARLSEITPGDELRRGFPVVELRAPIAGTVSSVDAVVGEHVLPEGRVLSIRDTSVVLIEARLPESDLAKLSSSGEALYETPDAPGRYLAILGEAGGRLIYLGQEVDPRTRTVPLVYETPNPEGRLRIGMALTVHVETAAARDAIVIPEAALIEDGGRSVIFVQISGESFQKRIVELGIRDAGYVQVLRGVEPGEQVATEGAFAVRLASVATSVPAHGHVH